jgi:Chlorophyll A-B binding protein
LPGNSLPIKSFDPLGLASLGSDETLRWLQAGEIKNSRTAMIATAGFLVQANGIHFPGMLSKDVSFESLSGLHPFEQWAAVPDAGKAQILFTCFIAEMVTEYKKPHYMFGGEFPTMVFPPIDFSNVDAATMKKKRTSEINNGRLAMIAIMSFISEYNIPGSVPLLADLKAFHH